MDVTLALDIGGTKIAAGLVDVHRHAPDRRRDAQRTVTFTAEE